MKTNKLNVECFKVNVWGKRKFTDCILRRRFACSRLLHLQFVRQRGGRWRHKQLHSLASSSPSRPSTYHTISLSPSPRVRLWTRLIVLSDDLTSLSVTWTQTQRHTHNSDTHTALPPGHSLASWQILFQRLHVNLI